MRCEFVTVLDVVHVYGLVFYFKDVVAESHGARGYFMEFKLENINTQPVELFAVGSSVMKSFP